MFWLYGVYQKGDATLIFLLISDKVFRISKLRDFQQFEHSWINIILRVEDFNCIPNIQHYDPEALTANPGLQTIVYLF